MRWYHENPDVCDKRIVVRFLWMPTRIGDETRWMERAEIEQEFRRYFQLVPEMPNGGCFVVGWRDARWLP